MELDWQLKVKFVRLLYRYCNNLTKNAIAYVTYFSIKNVGDVTSRKLRELEELHSIAINENYKNVHNKLMHHQRNIADI